MYITEPFYCIAEIDTTLKINYLLLFNCVQLFVTPRTVACQIPLFFTISRSLFKFKSTESVMLSNCLISKSTILQLKKKKKKKRLEQNTTMVSNSSKLLHQEDPKPSQGACLRKLQAAKKIYYLFQPTPEDARICLPGSAGGRILMSMLASQQTQLAHHVYTDQPFIVFLFPEP